MTQLLIRKAHPDEKEIIAGFQLLMARESEGMELDPAELLKGVEGVFDNSARGCYYVAETEGQLVASLLITYEWSDWRNRTVYWLQSLYVVPEYRRRGIFRAMYGHIIGQIREDPAVAGLRLYVDAGNLAAQEAYLSVGMDGGHYKVFEWMKDQDSDHKSTNTSIR